MLSLDEFQLVFKSNDWFARRTSWYSNEWIL